MKFKDKERKIGIVRATLRTLLLLHSESAGSPKIFKNTNVKIILKE